MRLQGEARIWVVRNFGTQETGLLRIWLSAAPVRSAAAALLAGDEEMRCTELRREETGESRCWKTCAFKTMPRKMCEYMYASQVETTLFVILVLAIFNNPPTWRSMRLDLI